MDTAPALPRRLALAWQGTCPIAAALLLAACTAVPAPPEGGAGTADVRWQRVRFYIQRNPAEPPQWHVDALLAHRLAAPLLERERPSIALWRFHRRAAGDATGHSMSLLTQASPATNERICRSLLTAPLAVELRQAKVLDRTECEAFPADRAQRVEATSDPRWSDPLQRAWPYFIMGVSELWLRLIEEQARRLGGEAPAATLEQSLAHYQKVNEAVTETWQREGHHALLHHLNALFGYEPIDLGSDGRRRF
jgi:hypothetical protein